MEQPQEQEEPRVRYIEVGERHKEKAKGYNLPLLSDLNPCRKCHTNDHMMFFVYDIIYLKCRKCSMGTGAGESTDIRRVIVNWNFNNPREKE